MIKAFAKFLLSLCILLLSVCGQLSANAHKESTCNTPAKDSNNSAYASFSNARKDLAFIINSFPSGTKSNSCKLTATVIEYGEEEDESTSKQFLESSHYDTALLYAHLPAYFSYSIENRLLSHNKHFSFILSPGLYLLFQVFRI